jgi:sulfur carrier protein
MADGPLSQGPQGPVHLTVNGEARSVPAGTTIQGLLQLLSVPKTHAAVERNGQVVPRKQHADVVVEDGDTLEVVTFVGGG